MITIAEQRKFLRSYRDTDRRIRCGQELTLKDRELIHTALTMVYTLFSTEFRMQDEALQARDSVQLPGQMGIADYPDYMPQQTTARRGKLRDK